MYSPKQHTWCGLLLLGHQVPQGGKDSQDDPSKAGARAKLAVIQRDHRSRRCAGETVSPTPTISQLGVLEDFDTSHLLHLKWQLGCQASSIPQFADSVAWAAELIFSPSSVEIAFPHGNRMSATPVKKKRHEVGVWEVSIHQFLSVRA
ncbi:hypothetical protein B0J13DRAFT_272562 [Dactylonectria estremocensis]|uniref:Uncharacterized protein n=1 Tax=Dactylonectria estremocensis TaxID=1079267 RepID=A0A9P9D2G0_9HYPO|nr:hypothetical protein B0J13DRAFT_272562 [Dactylonectria estremocensis]